MITNNNPEFDTEREYLPTCPYCGYRHEDYFEMEEGEQECQNCGKHFTVMIEREYYFTTRKIES